MKSFKDLRKKLREDYEYEMATNQLLTAERCIDALLPFLEGEGDLPAWIQSKISIATDHIVTVCDHLVSERGTKKEDYEYKMASNQLRTAHRCIKAILPILKGEGELPAWVQTKISVAVDYIVTAYDFMASERGMKEEASPAWQRKSGKNPEGGLNRKGIASYRREHPGSHLSLAVTTKPSKLKKGSKSANRRKSFCSRMKGLKNKLTSKKTANDPNSRVNKSLRKWNC